MDSVEVKFNITTGEKIDIRDLSNINPEVPGLSKWFFEIGKQRIDTETNIIISRKSNLYIYNWLFPNDVYPTEFVGSEGSGAYNAFLYRALKYLKQLDIVNFLDTINNCKKDADQYIKTQKDQTFIIISGPGESIPDHRHDINLYPKDENFYTLTYGIRMTLTSKAQPVYFSVKGQHAEVLNDSNVTRICFHSKSLVHGVKVPPDNHNLYLWLIFDGITEFKNTTIIPEAINIVNICHMKD